MCHGGSHVLVSLINFKCQCDCISHLFNTRIKAAEVCSTKGACHIISVVGISLLISHVEIAFQRGSRRPIKVQRAESICGTIVAVGIEDQLQALNTSCIEGGTTHGLVCREAFPQLASILQAPLNASHHSRSHGINLALHLVQNAVVDVASEHERTWHLLQGHFLSQLLLDLTGSHKLLSSGRRNWLQHMLQLTHRFQDLHAYLQCVIFFVDLLFEPAVSACAVGHSPIEDFLTRL
mmetsp:Transcript_25357/g.45934  ORF Transcript_25357/g.45934 Transcript_25357/m.45934 type:complete len:236 (+) Transcript_25357:806-1513(+)